MGREFAIGFDQVGNLRRRKNRAAAHEHQMQPHPERRQRPGTDDGVVRRLGADHQARGVEHPVPVPLLDRLVDGDGRAEIVARNDQALQDWISRALRKCMNSTPSRSRRFIMSQLLSISSVMSAIFRGRK